MRQCWTVLFCSFLNIAVDFFASLSSSVNCVLVSDRLWSCPVFFIFQGFHINSFTRVKSLSTILNLRNSSMMSRLQTEVSVVPHCVSAGSLLKSRPKSLDQSLFIDRQLDTGDSLLSLSSCPLEPQRVF